MLMTIAAFPAAIAAQSNGPIKAARRVVVPQPTTTVAGIMVSNDNWSKSSPDAGVYYIEVKPDGKITPQYKSAAMADVVCALKKDNIMYTAEATADFRYYWRQMNVSDWSTIGSRQEIDMEDVPASLAYDASLGRTFGSFWNENYGGFSFFGSFNLASASWSSIDKVQRDERDIFALASDSKGTIYCLFGAYDYLATLDPTTGQVNRIKTTGFEIDTNWAEGRISSMCYDEANDRLIAVVAETTGWGANKSYRTGLYTLNPHTGDVEKVMDFADNACFAGLYVVDETLNEMAPGEPTDLRANVEGVATVGTVSFTMPVKTVGGSDLSGSLIAIVNVNGVETPIMDLAPGQTVTSPSFNFITGENKVKVTIADSQRRGGSQSITFWAGEDTPKPVTDVVLSIENGAGILSWKAPTEGAHDGMIDPANLKYRIIRMPENKVVAEAAIGTSFTDSNIDTSVKTIYYSVAAYNTAGSAEAVESNRCLSFGSFSVPFSEGFDTPDDYALWTVENVNGGATWTYNNGSSEKTAQYEYDPDKLPADDWLISPPVRLEEGNSYKLSYKWRVMMKAYPESFEVKLGTAPESSSMTMPLGRHEKVSNTAFESADQAFSVPATGDYFIGVHCFSDSYMYILRVDDISIVELDNRIPATVSDLEVIPAAQGVRAATVKFTVPDKDNKGSDLESVTSAVIRRNGVQIASLTNVAPGQPVAYEDKNVGADGMVKYSVSCSNANGEGVEAVKEAYVGVDAPGAVIGLAITEKENHPYLRWTAPSKGVNGGWFDATAVTYRIVRSDGQVVAEAHSGTDFTDTGFTSPAKGQDAVWYLVTPYVGETKGAYAQSELLLCGTPYPCPLTETFAGADMKYYPWIAQSDNAVNYAWTLDNMGYNPQAADQNGDRGLATFHSVGEPVGTVSYFYSPKFDISGLSNPVLSFYLYHAEGEGDGSIQILVSDGSDTFSPLAGSDIIRRDSGSGWVRHAVSLKSCKNAEWIRIGFKGTGDGVADIYLDNVAVENQVETDLSIDALSVPIRIAAEEEVKCTARILNAGVNTVSGASLKVTDGNGTILTSQALPDIEAGRLQNVRFNVQAAQVGTLSVKCEIVADNDENPDNNMASATVEVVTPAVNAPQNLRASIEGGMLNLDWNAPESSGVITDNVEAYQDWAIDGIGQWSMWDGDYDITYMINTSYGDYPNSTARKAFQVCNADLLGINIWDEGKPHSGNKMLMALCSYTYVNNDWLISPELNGREQWIDFYARSFTLQNTPAERMRVWYSDTDNDPANFTEITTSYVELPGTWQHYRYYLPDGAKYFAINCVSDGAFAMFVDDISFNDLTVPTWILSHYEIYRDGVKIGEASDTSFTAPCNDEGGKYSVKAIYDRGEGPMSETVTAGTTGIASLNATIRVEGASGYIEITNAEGHDCRMITASGIVVADGTVESPLWRVNAQSGLYLVCIGEKSYKVIVK